MPRASILAAAGLALGLLVAPEDVPADEPVMLAQLFSGDLRERVDQLDAEVRRLRNQLAAGTSTSRLNDLEAEMRRLTASVEELQNRLDRIADDATRRFGDIEFRLTELEGGDPGAIPPTRPLGAPPGGGPAPQAAGGGDVSGAPMLVAEQLDLDVAVDAFQAGRMSDAGRRLEDFLQRYPGSPLEGQALFWLGEVRLAEGNPSEAARRFLAGYNADDDGPKAPDNLVRLGTALGRLGETEEACLTLAEVPLRFPAATQAVQMAEAERATLGCG